MPVITCPQCRSSVEVDAEHLGREVECGHCRGVFTATEKKPARDWGDRDDPYDDEPAEGPRRRRRRRSGFEPDEESYGDAVEAVRGPGNGLIAVGWLGAVLYFFVGIGFVVFGAMLLNDMQNANQRRDEEDAIMMIVLGGLAAVFGTIYSVLIAFGGHRLKALKGYGWIMTASIMGIATIALCHPCSPLSWANMGFGIWALIAVNKPVVKWAMEKNARHEE